MSENEHHHGDFRFFLGFFIGGLIGAVTIFLLGTKEGKKTGRYLEEKGKDLLDDLHDRKEEVVDRLMDKKEELTETATEKLDDALAHIEKMQEQGRDTTAELRKKLFKNLPRRR